MSLVCSATAVTALEALNAANLKFSKQQWRAFIVNVIVSAAEFPGVVHYLADSLSRDGLSILHISTFESEVFLIQEQDIERACDIFRRSERPTDVSSAAEILNHIQESDFAGKDARYGDVVSSLPERIDRLGSADNESVLTDLSSVSLHQFKDGLFLCAVPGMFMIARLNNDILLRSCSDILVSCHSFVFSFFFF